MSLQVDLTDKIPPINPKASKKEWPPEKFICSTPRLQDHAYLRVWDPTLGPNAGAPLGHHIIEDFGRCYGKHLVSTCKAKGWAINEHQAAGHRFRRTGGWGGKRVKKVAPMAQWVHPDALAGEKLIIELAKKRASAPLESSIVDSARIDSEIDMVENIISRGWCVGTERFLLLGSLLGRTSNSTP